MVQLPDFIFERIISFTSHPCADILNEFYIPESPFRKHIRKTENRVILEGRNIIFNDNEDLKYSLLIERRVLYRTLCNRFNVKVIRRSTLKLIKKYYGRYYKIIKNDILDILNINFDKEHHEYLGYEWFGSDDE